MRAAAFAIAILMSGSAAVAQTTTTEQTQTGWTTTATPTAPAGGMVVQPSNANPERDARGIAVISAPAVVPIGYNGTTGEAMGGPLLDPTTGQPVADARRGPAPGPSPTIASRPMSVAGAAKAG
jgi:hypothetical protein